MPAEFNCCECGIHVVDVIAEKPPAPPLCMHCLHIPGWHEDPQLRKIFGRDVPHDIQ